MSDLDQTTVPAAESRGSEDQSRAEVEGSDSAAESSNLTNNYDSTSDAAQNRKFVGKPSSSVAKKWEVLKEMEKKRQEDVERQKQNAKQAVKSLIHKAQVLESEDPPPAPDLNGSSDGPSSNVSPSAARVQSRVQALLQEKERQAKLGQRAATTPKPLLSQSSLMKPKESAPKKSSLAKVDKTGKVEEFSGTIEVIPSEGQMAWAKNQFLEKSAQTSEPPKANSDAPAVTKKALKIAKWLEEAAKKKQEAAAATAGSRRPAAGRGIGPAKVVQSVARSEQVVQVAAKASQGVSQRAAMFLKSSKSGRWGSNRALEEKDREGDESERKDSAMADSSEKIDGKDRVRESEKLEEGAEALPVEIGEEAGKEAIAEKEKGTPQGRTKTFIDSLRKEAVQSSGEIEESGDSHMVPTWAVGLEKEAGDTSEDNNSPMRPLVVDGEEDMWDEEHAEELMRQVEAAILDAEERARAENSRQKRALDSVAFFASKLSPISRFIGFTNRFNESWPFSGKPAIEYPGTSGDQQGAVWGEDDDLGLSELVNNISANISSVFSKFSSKARGAMPIIDY